MSDQGASVMDAWQADHAGRLLTTVAYVWSCGDDECGCSQAVIVEQYENKVAGPPWIVPVTIWEGPFHTDFERGAQDELDAELARRSRWEQQPDGTWQHAT